MDSDSTKDKVTWTKSMNLDLVKYMENKPHIWDPNHPKISNVGLRDETFARFAAEHDVDWMAVKQRWTNIRSTFGFYMRKIQARKKGGRDFKVGWFLWNPCKYLYKVHKLKSSAKSNKDTAIEQDDPIDDPIDDNDDASNGGLFSVSSQSQDISEETTDNTSCQGIVNSLSVVLKGMKNDAYGSDRSKYATVGEAVTTMLSQLNSYEAAQMTQKIVEILAEYDEKNPMNPNGLRYDIS